jgi:hypothetical protein
MSRYGRANAGEAVSTTVLPPGATVPVGWVAVGDPAEIYPLGQHGQIWAIQITGFPRNRLRCYR